jgi:hypothetical protein
MNQRFVNIIRDNITSCGYGKFDFCEKLLERELLMQEKPRILIRLICEAIEISPDKINYQTFCSWLRRYKKRCADAYSFKNADAAKASNGDAGWKAFKPSEPNSAKQEDPIIKIVK